MPRPVRAELGGVRDGPGRRFSYWITRTLREQREAAGISKANIASVLGDDTTTNLDRLERGDYGYGRDIDRAVAAYAYALGIDDARILWKQALDSWLEHGAPPAFTDEDLPGMSFVRPIRDELQRRQQARDAPHRRRNATRRTRAVQ